MTGKGQGAWTAKRISPATPPGSEGSPRVPPARGLLPLPKGPGHTPASPRHGVQTQPGPAGLILHPTPQTRCLQCTTGWVSCTTHHASKLQAGAAQPPRPETPCNNNTSPPIPALLPTSAPATARWHPSIPADVTSSGINQRSDAPQPPSHTPKGSWITQQWEGVMFMLASTHSATYTHLHFEGKSIFMSQTISAGAASAAGDHRAAGSDGNVAEMYLDTYSPIDPGFQFLGADLLTSADFARGGGIPSNARMRLAPGTPGGLVNGSSCSTPSGTYLRVPVIL